MSCSTPTRAAWKARTIATAAIVRTIGEWDGVERVWSLTTVEELVAGDGGAEPRRLLAPPWDAPDVPARAQAALDRNPDLTGWLVSADRGTAAFVIEIEDRPGDTAYRARLIGKLRALMAARESEGALLQPQATAPLPALRLAQPVGATLCPRLG